PLAGPAGLRVARRLPRRRREVRIAAPAAASLGGDEARPRLHEIRQLHARLRVQDERARRDRHLEVLSGPSVLLVPRSVRPRLRLEARAKLKVEKGAQVLVHDEDDAASRASIPAVGSPLRNVLLAPKADRAGAALPGQD